MYISLSRTCIQNFSNWHTLFIFIFYTYFTFSSRCCMKWDTACRPTDDPLKAFLSLGAQEPGSWKKYILGIHREEIIIPAPFHSKAFVLLYKFETSWALLGRLSRVFSGHLMGLYFFKHFKQLFMTLSGLGLLTM